MLDFKTLNVQTLYTPAQVDALLKRIILNVYFEFVFSQRDINLWLAGMATMGAIKP